jgi:hypothetical protein
VSIRQGRVGLSPFTSSSRTEVSAIHCQIKPPALPAILRNSTVFDTAITMLVSVALHLADDRLSLHFENDGN